LSKAVSNSQANYDPGEPLKEYGSIGDLGRYSKLALSLVVNFAFALFVGYVLGQMADDTFLSHYDGTFTIIGLVLGFVGVAFGTRKRVVRFTDRQEELHRKRAQKLRGFKAQSSGVMAVAFCAIFAGVSRIGDFIYAAELEAVGASLVMYLDLIAVGLGLTLLGIFTLLGNKTTLKSIRWALLLPAVSGGTLAYLALAGGAKLNVVVTMALLAITPLVGFFIDLLRRREEKTE